MNNTLQLIKITLKERLRVSTNGLGGGQNKIPKKPTYIVFWIIMAVVFLPILIGMALLAFSMGQLFAPFGGEVMANTVSTVITFVQMIMLIVGMTTLVTTLYHSSDNEILLALPIKPREIFLAKLAVVYIFELGTALVSGIFLLVPFGIGASMGIGYFIGLIPVMLMMPLFPLLVATLVGIPVMYIVSAMKGNGGLSTVIMCVAFGGLFVGYYLLLYKFMPQLEESSMEALAQMLKDFVTGFGGIIYPNKLLGAFVTAENIGQALLSLLIATVIYAIALLLVLLIASAVYRKIISRGLEHGKAASKASSEIKTGSIEAQLVAKEMKTITRFGSLGFNCFMQVIMGIALPVIMSAGFSQPVSPEESNAITQLVEMESFFAFIVMAFSCMLVATNIAAAGAFSREGNDFALTKALPLKAKSIVKSKVIVALIFNAITLFASCLIMAIMGVISLPYCLLTFVCAMIYGAFQVYVGVYVDLLKPRLHWRTVSEGLKNNPATLAMMISYAVTLVLFVILFFVGMLFAASPVLGVVVQFGLFAVVSLIAAIVVRNMLMNKAEELIDRVEV